MIINMKQYKSEWYLRNKEYRKLYEREWRVKNAKKKRKTNRAYELREKTKLVRKKYRDTHKKQSKKYREENKEKIIQQICIWTKNKLKTDNKFRLLFNLRTRLYSAIKNNQKSGHTLELLGCDIDFLKNHLESQFKDGMSWDNYGTGKNGKGMQEWHIDHIYPCASFDLSKPEEQKICFHWSNLRPLWAKENLERSKR